MTYLHLLSPEGEAFEVIEARVGALLANGWTFNPGPLKDAIARIDEVTNSVTSEVSIDPVAPQGAIADAEVFANDVSVDVVEEPVEAGPAVERQELDVIDGPATTKVSEDAGVRKSRRGFATTE